MDVKCRFCTEPIDIDELHSIAEEAGQTFKQVELAFRQKGCTGIGYTHNIIDAETLGKGKTMGELADLLGDDVDGIAAMIEEDI